MYAIHSIPASHIYVQIYVYIHAYLNICELTMHNLLYVSLYIYVCMYDTTARVL